jgi:CheY-like chemotaxis protein
MAVEERAQAVCRTCPRHLLLAEDEPGIAVVLSEYFMDAGYRVTSTADGMEALEVLPTASFDLLLTDIRMPRLDGVTLLQHVRQSRPDMPIVVLSGYMTDEDRKALGHLGVPDYAVLEKPSSLSLLEKTVRNALVGLPEADGQDGAQAAPTSAGPMGF